MRKIGRVRKAVAAALGFAAFYVALVPEEMIPEQWRPWVGLVLAAAGVAGVYKAPNATAPLPTRLASEAERRNPFDGP